MQAVLSRKRLCHSCSNRLLSIFEHGISFIPSLPRQGSRPWTSNRPTRNLQSLHRPFTNGRVWRASVEHDEIQHEIRTRTPAQMEAIARQARQTFGETLPKDFLSSEEYMIYERLYGPPSATTLPEDEVMLQGIEDVDDESSANVLMRENAEGNLEEVVYEEEDLEEDEEIDEVAEVGYTETDEEFRGRMALFRDIAAANSSQSKTSKDKSRPMQDISEESQEEDSILPDQDLEYEEEEEEFEREGNAYENSDSARTHPLTAAGRFATSPATIQISKDSFVDPVTVLLGDASNKQLTEMAQKTFGGPGLPNSTATLARANLKQQPIALEASQFRMGEMEGNAYLAAIMPGAYATVMSTLVEIRKRLGHEWLRSLFQKADGPRILDAGAGGAGVLAWQEVLRAEWELMHPGGVPHDKPTPYGKSTVVTGSSVLRNRASHLLDNTTFIPRLPDYNPSRDHPSLEDQNPQPRKQYDIILAPHTLWSLKENYMRKNQIQNFWSLLDPKGGVLVLIEKGVPRGFELIAGARETLLKHHISSPGAEEVEHTIEDGAENRFGPKEKGMIIAPCTNHAKCPMYITAGQSKGRKDYCHFSQRYIRPPFLQRIVGAKKRNHEDIKFSYVALQRGVDQREVHDIVQGQPATEAAFSGYEEADSVIEDTELQRQETEPNSLSVNPLGLPRAILPPIKRRGHVILDLCTPAGKIERWTVPRSFSKQAYHDARKSKWGDLWALGAKTRVLRNIRVGLKKNKSQQKDILDRQAEDADDVQDSTRPAWQTKLKKRLAKKGKMMGKEKKRQKE